MYSYILVFIVTGVGFILLAFLVAYLVSPQKPGKVKLSPYECGEMPFGIAWSQYNVRYYLFAIVFLIFDVEAVFLYPWVLVFKSMGLFGLIEMFSFLLVLICGLVYAWKKGALEWM
ncbi:MAG: NADH-quinone oxidoreductase subunit A [Candidatus Stahlbacteria bacterium]|nr:NADH-quinone oxidoreductase subunit A [Candidatus Stahlbacteria bacterium]